MIETKDINKIKNLAEEFFNKMTIIVSGIEANLSLIKQSSKVEHGMLADDKDVVDLEIEVEDPQILIGQGGQTLFEIQRLLRMVLNKKTEKIFYLNLDINDYKKKKVEYLKDLAKELANQVSVTKEEKILPPMSAYERRIIHAELSERSDVITESQGGNFDRHVVIKVK